MKGVLSVILGGGRGTRLYPLTKYRAKPAVPFAGKYRLIDVPISNCLNSGLNKIFILTQFNSESLNRHISRAYKLDYFTKGFVEIIAAEQSMEHTDWFQGSADAVRKCLKHFTDPRIKYLLILSGDQLYKMDLLEFVKFHIEKGSDATVACNVIEQEEVSEFGIMGVDNDSKIKRFVEKPKDKQEIAGLGVPFHGKQKYLASMGIYLFNKDVLFDLLGANDKADFGKEIIPDAVASKKTYAYAYHGYWKDIGTIKSFYEENLLFARQHPPLELYDENWQFYTRPRYLPPSRIEKASIENSSISEGVILGDTRIKESIIGLRSVVQPGTMIEESLLLGFDYYDFREEHGQVKLGIGKNCHIRKAIVDKNVRIGDNVKILNEKKLHEFENQLCVIRNGIVVIPKNTVIPPGTVI